MSYMRTPKQCCPVNKIEIFATYGRKILVSEVAVLFRIEYFQQGGRWIAMETDTLK